MEIQFKHMLYVGVILVVALGTVEATCNKETVKYMLVKVCGYTNKRSFIDSFFHVLTREEVDRRYNELVQRNEILLSDPSILQEEKYRYSDIDIDTAEKFSPRLINPLKNVESSEVHQELDKNGKSRSRRLYKRSVINPPSSLIYKKNGERTEDTAKIMKYEGNLDELLSGIVKDNEDLQKYSGQNLFDKCCNSLCSINDFMGYCF